MSETDTNRQNDTEYLPAEPSGAVQDASEPRLSDGRGEIPKFDLAEQILAEQRKITAIRRKAPIKKNEPPTREWEAESIGYKIQQPPLTLSEQGQIIAEIVARDIEKLRRGDILSLRRPDFKATNIHPE